MLTQSSGYGSELERTIPGQDKPNISELMHYGVKGMKWGVVNEDRGSDRSSKKADKRENKARNIEAVAAKAEVRLSEIKSEIDALPPGLKTTYKRSVLNTQKANQADYVRLLHRDAQWVREGKLTQNQKVLLAGGILAGSALALYGAAMMADSGQLNSLSLRGEAFLKGKRFQFAKKDSLAQAATADSVLSNVVKGVNPNYDNAGGQMNCRRCSLTYELRRRGFDVEATPTSVGTGHTETGLINALTPGKRNLIRPDSLSSKVVSKEGIRAVVSGDKRINPADTVSLKQDGAFTSIRKQLVDKRLEMDRGSPEHMAISEKILKSYADEDKASGAFKESVVSSLSKMPNKARGEIVFDFGQFGHSMSWEIFDGKPVIFDSQKANMYDLTTVEGLSMISKKWGSFSAAEITRLDNMDLDLSFLTRWATNV